MTVEPHEPKVVGTEPRHNRLLAVAVAREHNRHHAVPPSSSNLARQLPVEVKAGGNFGSPRLSERDPAHIVGAENCRSRFGKRQRPGAHALRLAADDIGKIENARRHGDSLAALTRTLMRRFRRPTWFRSPASTNPPTAS